MTVGALFMFIPMAIGMSLVAPQVDQHGNPIEFPFLMFAIMPFFYLIFGYIFIALSCAIYNFSYKYIGGLEFEAEEKSAEQQ